MSYNPCELNKALTIDRVSSCHHQETITLDKLNQITKITTFLAIGKKHAFENMNSLVYKYYLHSCIWEACNRSNITTIVM